MKLKPCPFCGSEDISIEGVQCEQYNFAAWCSNCDADGPTAEYNCGKDNEEVSNKAAELWNKRGK